MLGEQRRRSEQVGNVDMLQDLPWPKLKRRARVDICKADIKKKKYDDAGSKKRVLSVVFSEGEAAIEDIAKQADEEVEANVSQLQRGNDSLSSYESGGDDMDTLRTRLASALEANKELQVKLDNSRVGTRLLLACNKALRGKVEELRLDAANKENEFKKIVANDLLSKIENHESAEAQNDLKFDQMRKDKERIELEYKISKLFNSVQGIPVTALNSVQFQYKINVDKTKLLEGELGFSNGRLNEEKTQSVEKQHSDLVPSNVTKVGGNVQEPQETTAKNRDLILDTRLTKLKKVVRNEKEKNKELHEKLSCLQTMFNTSVQQEQSLKDELANKEADLTRQKSKWVNLLTRLNKEESETLLLYIDNFHLHDQICIFFIHKMFSISSKC